MVEEKSVERTESELGGRTTAQAVTSQEVSMVGGRYGAIHLLSELPDWVQMEHVDDDVVYDSFDEVKYHISTIGDASDIDFERVSLLISNIERLLLNNTYVGRYETELVEKMETLHDEII